MSWARTIELEAIQSLLRVWYSLSFLGGGGGNFATLYAGAIMLLTTGRTGMSHLYNFKLLSVTEAQIFWIRYFISLINDLTTLLQCLLDLFLVFFCRVFVKFGEMVNSKKFAYFL